MQMTETINKHPFTMLMKMQQTLDDANLDAVLLVTGSCLLYQVKPGHFTFLRIIWLHIFGDYFGGGGKGDFISILLSWFYVYYSTQKSC